MRVSAFLLVTLNISWHLFERQTARHRLLAVSSPPSNQTLAKADDNNLKPAARLQGLIEKQRKNKTESLLFAGFLESGLFLKSEKLGFSALEGKTENQIFAPPLPFRRLNPKIRQESDFCHPLSIGFYRELRGRLRRGKALLILGF